MISGTDINSIESEAGVIATLIHNPNFCFFSEQLLPNHFYDLSNRLVYTAICDLARRDISNIDVYNILEVLNSSDATKRVSEELTIEKLQELIEMSDVLCRSSIEEYQLLVKNILDAAFRRDTYKKLKECQAMCFDKSEKDIERKIYSTLDEVMMDFSSTSEVPLYKDVVDDLWEDIELRQGGAMTSIELPFPALKDYVVMESGEVICFAGGAKSGKSAMLLTCTVDFLKKGKSVLYIDSEISTRLFTMRLISHLTGIKFSDVRSGNYGLEEAEVIKDAIAWIKDQKFIHLYLPIFDDNSMYLAAMKAKHLIDVDIIVVDYLKSTSGSDEAFATYAEMGRLSDTLKNKICGDLGLMGLTAVQATSTGKIADSARVARSVSTVISIQDKTLEEIETDNTNATKKIRVTFNRNGAQMVDGEWIDMVFDGSHCKYEQAPVQHTIETPY